MTAVSLCKRNVKSLVQECQIALSGFLDRNSATCQLSLPVEITSEEKNCWNGRRITVFGETCSGVSSLCSMFTDVSATMSDTRKKSEQFGPLTLKLHFGANRDEPLVCTELDGTGHYRLETQKPLKELVSMFPIWRSLFETTLEVKKEAVDHCDLVDLRNHLVTSLQDIDDVFAIRLGFILSDTVVIVHHGNNLLNIRKQVDNYLGHYDAVPTKEADVASLYSGIVRNTTNIFIVVNFFDSGGSLDFNQKSFHDWTESEGLRCESRQPRGQSVAIRLYSKGLGARASRCKVTFIPLFRDPEGRGYNSAVIAYILQNTAPPQHRQVELESPFDPVELAVQLLLPSFYEGTPPILQIAQSDPKDCPTHKMFTLGTQERKKSTMLTIYQGPDEARIGGLQTLTEKDAERDLSGKEILCFAIAMPDASNISVTKMERISSGNVTFFHILATYGNPGCLRLYGRLVRLQGICTYFKGGLKVTSEKVVFVFKKCHEDTGIDID